jgi:polyamine oxidase
MTTLLSSRLNAGSIMLNKIVETIDTHEGIVTVTTQDGTSVKGRSVLVTASIGVLRSGMINFSPQLPEWKIKAIESTIMTSYAKVFVLWERRWWDDLADNPESTHTRNLYTVLLDDGED